ncbi:right-handed parallel beta-helix repeat-containing protein [Smaragdicoccus niigatensis]|uniref:right-handed parallel beta-helix repeat-containing protein n=1 Tax=Smaragdicoccus niigatensis TaxID=359359 RepID=UPI000376B4FC|nr:right-handed parallel beta-helix repeat-containing protein [Smaragdicoccus niigatensis]
MHHVQKSPKNRSLIVGASLSVGAVVLVTAAGFGVHALLQKDNALPNAFYVSASGDDKADGRTPQTAWKTLARVSEARLAAGEQVLLEGGSRFRGQIVIDHGADDPQHPLVIGSYGDGRAQIVNDQDSAVVVANRSGVTVQDLEIVGPGAAVSNSDGIAVYNDKSSPQRQRGIVIQRVSVAGFKHGIAAGAVAGAPGFDGLDIHDALVKENRLSGLFTYGSDFDPAHPTYSHTNVRISRVEAAGNTGDPTLTTNSGSGIVLGSVEDGIVEYSTAHHNGALSDTIEGPAGIWTYDSTRIRIEHNLAYNNTTGEADGHGFDLDQNVSDSTLEYNLSYDNAGAGYMLFSNANNQTHRNNQVRFNVSVNDATASGFYGAITIFGGTQGPDSGTGVFDAQVYHNTVVTKAHDGVIPPTVLVLGNLHDIKVLNNVFVANTGAQLTRAKEFTPDGITFGGNVYYAERTGRPFEWNGELYSTLAAWRASSEQELMAGRPVGVETNPDLRGLIGSPTSIRNASQLKDINLRLDNGSPLVGTGVDLGALKIDRGREDYFADELTKSYDAGAAAVRAGR